MDCRCNGSMPVKQPGEIMKTIKNKFSLMTVAAAIFVSVSALAQNANASFTLSVTAKHQEYRPGDEVNLTIIQKNISNHLVYCTINDVNYVNTQLQYDVRDQYGDPAAKTVWSKPVPPPVAYHACGINPGDSYTETIRLSHAYKFNLTGKYVIQVSRFDPDLKDDQGNAVKVLSNTITITITS